MTEPREPTDQLGIGATDMTDNTQPDAGSTHIIRYALEMGLLWIDGDGRGKVREALAALDALEAQRESIAAGGVSGPLMGQPQEMPDLSALTERGANAWAGVDAQGLRAGVAPVAANAGSEPVARVNDDGFIVEIGDLLLAPGQKLYLHPSPPEGMVGGWISVEDRLPKLYTEVLIHPRPTAYCCEGEVDTQGRWSYGEYETGFGHHQIACEVTHWMPLPPPPTTSAGSGKGE